MTAADQFITEVRRSDAAQIVGLKAKTLANMYSAGEGPTVIKRGRLPYYPVQSLLEWHEQRAEVTA